MPLSYVTITGTFDDGAGNPVGGHVTFTPSQAVHAGGIPLVTVDSPITVQVTNGVLGTVRLLATDQAGLSYTGLTGFFFWTVAAVIDGVAVPEWSFFLPSSPSSVDLYSLANTPAGASGIIPPAGDIGGNAAAPTVVATHLAAPMPLAQGGTGVNAGSAAALLAALGALPVAGGTLTGRLAPAVVPLTFGGAIAVNAALGNVFAVTLTSSAGALANPTNPADGQAIRVRVIQDATGGRTLAYGSAYDFGTAGPPTLSTAANAVDILGFEYVASLSKWCYLGSAAGM